MKKKYLTALLLIVGVISLFILEYIFINKYICPTTEVSQEKNIPQAMMLLIEFGKTDGLVNMVNDMKERNIHGILLINGDFIEDNAPVIKEVLKTGVIELGVSYDPEPFWDMPYEKQYHYNWNVRKSELYLGVTPRIIALDMASDATTVQMLNRIEYIQQEEQQN